MELGAGHKIVKRARRLILQRSARRDEGVLVAEGVSVVQAALEAGADVEALFVAPEAERACPEVLHQAAQRGLRVHRLGSGVMERIAGTVTPQPVFAVVRWRDSRLDELSGADLVLVGVDVRDPGNAGTLLRSAEAAGAAAVVLCAGSVEATNPKTVRASAGSIFHVHLVEGGDPLEVLDVLARMGLHRLGAVAHGGKPYDQVDLTGPVALVVGNEAWGLPESVDRLLDGRVTIPHVGRSESLNVGMAASILLFEARRQRSAAGEKS